MLSDYNDTPSNSVVREKLNSDKIKNRMKVSFGGEDFNLTGQIFEDELTNLKKRRKEDFSNKRNKFILASLRKENKSKALEGENLNPKNCSNSLNSSKFPEISNDVMTLGPKEVNYIKEMLKTRINENDFDCLTNFVYSSCFNEANKNLMIDADIPFLISQVFKTVHNENIELLKSALMSLVGFCDREKLKYYQIKPTLNRICRYIKSTKSTNEDLMVSMLWIFSFAADEYTKKTVNLLLIEDMIPSLMNLLEMQSEAIKSYSLRLIGSICASANKKTQKVLDADFLPVLKRMTKSPVRAIRKDAVWIISNIAVGDQYQIQAIIEEDFFPLLKEIVQSDFHDIKKEAIWAICNLSNNKNPYHAEILIEQGILESLVNFLQSSNPNFIIIALEALSNFLELDVTFYQTDDENDKPSLLKKYLIPMGFLEILEKLQFHANDTVYEKSLSLIDNYLTHNENDDYEIC